jgi:hypothetical protein
MKKELSDIEQFAWSMFQKHEDIIKDWGCVIFGYMDGTTSCIVTSNDLDTQNEYNTRLLSIVGGVSTCLYKSVDSDRKMFVMSFGTKRMDYVLTNILVMDAQSFAR